MAEHQERARVLVVDDEPYIVEMIAMSLRYVGYQVETAASGEQALKVAGRTQPDLIVLDIMLPDIQGFDLLRTLRRDTGTPVLFLTAKDSVENRVRGLTLGADDYVTKPFSLEELVARIGAILRRTSGGADRAPEESNLLRYGDLVMDEDGHEVWRQGQAIKLSPPSSRCCGSCCATPAASCHALRSSNTSGTTTSTATPASSTPTSGTCAARWMSSTRR